MRRRRPVEYRCGGNRDGSTKSLSRTSRDAGERPLGPAERIFAQCFIKRAGQSMASPKRSEGTSFASKEHEPSGEYMATERSDGSSSAHTSHDVAVHALNAGDSHNADTAHNADTVHLILYPHTD